MLLQVRADVVARIGQQKWSSKALHRLPLAQDCSMNSLRMARAACLASPFAQLSVSHRRRVVRDTSQTTTQISVENSQVVMSRCPIGHARDWARCFRRILYLQPRRRQSSDRMKKDSVGKIPSASRAVEAISVNSQAIYPIISAGKTFEARENRRAAQWAQKWLVIFGIVM